MVIEFKSFSNFARKVLRHFSDPGLFTKDTTLTISLTKEPNNLIDLFVLGRLIAFIHELKNSMGINTEFVIPHSKDIDNLINLGFFDYCQKNQINVVFKGLKVDQIQLLPLIFNNSRLQSTINKRIYWHCLVPITTCPIPNVNNEREIFSLVSRFIRDLIPQLKKSFSQIGIDFRK